MPRLRRANAHHRDLQAGAKATDPSTTTKGRRMTRCPSKCKIPAPSCTSSGWSILLPQAIQYAENAPMFIVIKAKIMPPKAYETLRMPSHKYAKAQNNLQQPRTFPIGHTQHPTASSLRGLSTRAKVSPAPKPRAVARIEKPSSE